jgi:hypothetical protein
MAMRIACVRGQFDFRLCRVGIGRGNDLRAQ